MTIDTDIDHRGVAHLWLDRPEKHNALSGEMLDDLSAAASAIAQRDDIRVVILAARGPSFCAGGDLGWMRAQMRMDATTRKIESRKIATALGALANLPQPLIGRVHGNAFGGGVGLASVCDVTIGVPAVRMGFTETRLGLIPANIGPYVVARMGVVRAREVFMSARLFDAEEAVRLQLLTRVVTPQSLDEAIEAEVAPYLGCAPGAVAEAKVLLGVLGGRVDPLQIDLAIDALAARWETDEAREGINAFFDRRAPEWHRDT
jgi:methylglutaconyl-CoA hydratase